MNSSPHIRETTLSRNAVACPRYYAPTRIETSVSGRFRQILNEYLQSGRGKFPCGRKMKQSKEDATDEALAALLDVLASILVPLEVTPTRLAQIARVSFVKATANHARMRSSGRPHLARIAALTGLSRAEVKRVVSTNYKPPSREPENSPRALRVLSAWRASKGYSRAGKELALRVTGAFPSFETLCRAYSGDIPYRVILTELERKKRVKLGRNRTWISVAKNSDLRVARQPELSNLIFAASIVGALSEGERVLVKRQAKVRAPNAIQDSYVENSIASRVTALLDNLPQMFVSRGKSRQSTNRVTVYTVVSRSERARKLRS